MLATNYTNARNNLKEYCDKVFDNDETVVITRKGDRNVVIVSLDEYNRMAKALRNLEYLSKIEQSVSQIENGKCTVHEIIEV